MIRIRQILNKVPEITIYFWVIKILCTTVGETAADYLNETLHFGLINTSYVMGAVLIVILFFQFKTKKYIPSIYWFAVVAGVGAILLTYVLLRSRLGLQLQATPVG